MENETKIVVATKQLDSLESILMNSIEKINENAEFVKQAEMINKTAKNLIDLNKLKLKAIVELGKKIYPLIKQTTGLPDTITTALELIVFEAK